MKRIFCLVVVFGLLWPRPAAAQWRKLLDKVVFTGGTSVVFPVRGFLPTVSPAFSAATGADYQLTDRFLLQGTFAYNRHRFESSRLYPGINLQSNTELLSLYVGGRYLLGRTGRSLRPYVVAGGGYGILSEPSVTPRPGPVAELDIGSRSRSEVLLTAGAGLDFTVSPTLILYLESAYFRAVAGPRLDYIPVIVGVRTYPSNLLRKQ